MIFIGHEKVPFEPLYECLSIKDIEKTPSNSTLLLRDDCLIKHCNSNNIAFALIANNIQDLLIYSALHCAYLLIDNKDFAIKAQEIAQIYLLDSKILFMSNNYSDIEMMAQNGIDGIIFLKNGLKLIA